MVDLTTINGFFDFFLHGLDQYLFGSIALSVILILLFIFLLLTFFNANKFTAFGFMSCGFLAMGIYGYSFFGWIAPLGAILAGLLLGLAFVRILNL